MKIRFVKQDLWVGLYWKSDLYPVNRRPAGQAVRITTFYLCILPCLPIIWEKRGK